MKSIYLLLSVALFCATLSYATDLHLGNPVGGILVYQENVKLSKIPLTTRTKNVFFSSDKNQAIRAISAIDNKRGKAKVSITSGGIGSAFVNVRIKSERGEGLDYQVLIHA